MPIKILVRSSALAIAFLVATPLVHAAEDLTSEGHVADVHTVVSQPVESDPSEASAVAATATHGLFSSWFGSKPGTVDTADTPGPNDGQTALSATRSMLTMGIPPTGSLVVGALGLLGISYRFGGNTPDTGFDCSGMVRYVFQNALGLDLPRRAIELSRVGTHIDRNALKPGDLVFYKTLRNAFSHVGIYLGNNRFIHAPSAGGSVRVDDMSQSYWASRFNGARRIVGN